MRKGYREFLGRIGWTEKTFLVLLAIYAVLRLIGQSPTWQFLTALAAFVFGSIVLVRLTYSVTRKAIWRLRNRLIVSYLFIAVVPIVLIVLLADTPSSVRWPPISCEPIWPTGKPRFFVRPNKRLG